MSDEMPTADEIRRVGDYWQRLKAQVCGHPEVTFSTHEEPTCIECGQPLRWMSEVQIEKLVSERNQ